MPPSPHVLFELLSGRYRQLKAERALAVFCAASRGRDLRIAFAGVSPTCILAAVLLVHGICALLPREFADLS